MVDHSIIRSNTVGLSTVPAAAGRGRGPRHNGGVGFLSRLRGRTARQGTTSSARGPQISEGATRHLTEFATTRRGVEAWVEPATAVTGPTLLLVAHDGEWTRRGIPTTSWGHSFAEHLQMPGYDAGVVGYPQRMRDWNSRQKRR